MLNYLWAGMILVGIVWAGVHGTLGAVTDGALEAAKEAVTLSITMLGIMSFWCGILKIAEESGLIEAMTKKMRPIISFLFPQIPEGHPAAESISMNMIANIMGLGWAATPAGLKAMEELERLEESRRKENFNESNKAIQNKTIYNKTMRYKKRGPVERGTANNEMCTFLIINISSLQLIPINMIAYRSEYGSMNPTGIVGPAFVATSISTIVGILFCKIMQRKNSL